MNKNDLIAELADKAGLTKAKATETLDAMTAIISKALSYGADVRIVGFGTFTVTHRKATEGRNPRTGAVIQIPAMKKPKFKAGMALSAMVNKNSKKK